MTDVTSTNIEDTIDDTYTTGGKNYIAITFSEAVNVTSTPYLELALGTTTHNAIY